ncbi:hypothetical protein [Curtobacterium sp. MCBA15_001]|uniref:hypothetical protein n=1 Tax=Curtobacterium sp. MCBA15_001 TaxID=1898731 RepID=UPI00111455CB|nr:hypothetical protein [Curtobacterium sp. MCBA15_001]
MSWTAAKTGAVSSRQRSVRAAAVAITIGTAMFASAGCTERPLIGERHGDRSVGWESRKAQTTAFAEDATGSVDAAWAEPGGVTVGECTHADEDGVFFESSWLGAGRDDAEEQVKQLQRHWQQKGYKANVGKLGQTSTGADLWTVTTFDAPGIKSAGYTVSAMRSSFDVEGLCGYGITAYELWDEQDPPDEE